MQRDERVAPSEHVISALGAHVDGYGPAVNDLKRLWIQKYTFGVDGLI